MRKHLLLLFFPLLLCGCYEDRLGCLEPDATNFDERADDTCPDNCCTFPDLTLDVGRFWGEDPFLPTDTLRDGAGNAFSLARFRFYLSDISLGSADGGSLPVSQPLTTAVLAGNDTLSTTFNANIGLIESTGTTLERIGSVQIGRRALTQVQGLFGMAADFPAVFPPRVPTGSPLATQEGRLNFNDGNGYLLGSLEVRLLPDSTLRRIDLRGNLPAALPFPFAVVPNRGTNLTVEMIADYRVLLGDLDLRADTARLAEQLRSRLPDFLVVTGVR